MLSHTLLYELLISCSWQEQCIFATALEISTWKWFTYHQTCEFLQSYTGGENNIAFGEINKEIQKCANYLFDLLVDNVEDAALVVIKKCHRYFTQTMKINSLTLTF